VSSCIRIPACAKEAKPAIRVFVVDDDPTFAEIFSEMLGLSGEFTVAGAARGGEEALQTLEGLPVDLVILNLILRGMGGLRVLQALRKKGCKANIVMCSGLVDDSAITEAFVHGANAFVEKSAALQETISTLREVSAGKFWMNPRHSSLVRDFLLRREVGKAVHAGDQLLWQQLSTSQTAWDRAGRSGLLESDRNGKQPPGSA